MSEVEEKTWYSKAQLKEMFDGWWPNIISHVLTQKPDRKKGQLKKYAFITEPPTKEQYNLMRIKQFTRSIGDAVGEAESIVEEMKNELEEWAENIPENFEEKKSEIEEAGYMLDSALNNIQSVDLHEFCESYEFYCTPYQYPVFRGRPNMSRRQRNSHALELLELAKSTLEDVTNEMQERIDALEQWNDEPVAIELAKEDTEKYSGAFEEKTADELEEIKDSAESSINELENAIGELENVEYPGR